MRDTEASLRKEWNELFDRVMALGAAKGQKNIAQMIKGVVREVEFGGSEQVIPNDTAKIKPKTSPKKRPPVKKLVAKVLKDNSGRKDGAGKAVGMSPPDIRIYAKTHFNKDLRTESIRQALIRMDENGEAHKNGRGWHYGPKPEQSGVQDGGTNPAEPATNEHSAGYGQGEYSGGHHG